MADIDERAHGAPDGVEADRDALRRELDDLRTRLCELLGVLREEPGAEGRTVPSVAPDHEILAEVSRLVAAARPAAVDGEETGRRWSQIDTHIVRGRKIHALQAIRLEFSGGIPEALELLRHRHERLRRDRPEALAQDPATYWDGFRS